MALCIASSQGVAASVLCSGLAGPHGEPLGTLWLYSLHADMPPQVGSIGGQSALPPQLSGLLDLLAAEGGLPTANITAAGNKTLARMRRQVRGAGRCLLGVISWAMLAVVWREVLACAYHALPPPCLLQLPPAAPFSHVSPSSSPVLQVGEKDEAKAGARFVVDRMLPNLWNIGFIAMSLPDACLLHVVR